MTAPPMLLALALCLALGCASPTAPDAIGQWGGTHANLTLTEIGGTVEFDCGSGVIDPGWILSASGRFAATGVFFHGGGPEPIEGRPPVPAHYSGIFRDSRLTLTITLTGEEVPLGPFELERGRTAALTKCY
jgi:hypothetical protein